MKNKELLDSTVGILVQAYRNDILRHQSCTSCAVGSIIAERMGYGTGGQWFTAWVGVFVTITGIDGEKNQNISENSYTNIAKKQIDSTGYTWQELAKIEYAFETAPEGNSDDDWMFNGLLAVYDVLCEIHEVDISEVKTGELVFVK